MIKKKIKLGFVGTGQMGQCGHLRNYYLLDSICEIKAIAELRTDVRRKVASRYSIRNTYDCANAMISNEQLDALVVIQPSTRHGILLDELIRTGLPIFIEKPLASSIQVGEKIVKQLKESSSKIMVGFQKRLGAEVTYAKQKIDEFKESKLLGNLKYIRITAPLGDWIAGGFSETIKGEGPEIKLDHDSFPLDFNKETNKKYFELTNVYVHQINLMRFFLGEDYYVTYADPEGILLIGRSSSGVICCIEINPYETTIDWQETALISFEKGYIEVELPAPLALNRPGKVKVFLDPGNGEVPKEIMPQFPWIHALKYQAEHFIKFAKGEADAPCNAEEALKDLYIIMEYINLLLKVRK